MTLETRERVPLNWAWTTLNLTRVEIAYFENTGKEARLNEAEQLGRAAQEVFAAVGAGHHLGLADALLDRIAALRAPPPPSAPNKADEEDT